MIRRISRYFRKHVGKMTIAFLCMAVDGAVAGVTAWLVKPVMDDVFINSDQSMLTLLPLVLVGLYLAKGVCRYAQTVIMTRVGETVVIDIRNELTEKIMLREVGYFDKNSTGDLVSRVLTDVARMRNTIPNLIQIARHVLTACGLIFVLFARDGYLTMIAFIVLPFAVWPVTRISQLMKRHSRKSQEQMGGISKVLVETFTGIEVIKAYNATDSQSARFCKEGDKLLTTRMKVAVGK